MPKFSWVPIYAELADKILEYQDRQHELLDLIERLRSQGLPAISTDDQFSDGSSGRLDIDDIRIANTPAGS